MTVPLRLRRARITAAIRTFLDLPTPFDDDQDDYWTDLPRSSPSDDRPSRPTRIPGAGTTTRTSSDERNER